jgi:uncharacterized Zn-finger protein
MQPDTGFFPDSTEFESYGSSPHTPYIADLQARIAAGDPTLDLSSPLALFLNDFPEDVPGENTELYDDDPIQRSYSSPPTPMDAEPRSLVDTAPSPTPSLSYSVQSTLSTPSPAPIVDDKVLVLKEDVEDGSPVPSSPASPVKRGASALSAPSAKNRNLSMNLASLPSARAARYPCTIPGCKQVCKTLGDLKRHESVLAHKAPSWECSRCQYRFTREDALKRHVKTTTNCEKNKARVRGRVVSINPQPHNVGAEAEVV